MDMIEKEAILLYISLRTVKKVSRAEEQPKKAGTLLKKVLWITVLFDLPQSIVYDKI